MEEQLRTQRPHQHAARKPGPEAPRPGKLLEQGLVTGDEQQNAQHQPEAEVVERKTDEDCLATQEVVAQQLHRGRVEKQDVRDDAQRGQRGCPDPVRHPPFPLRQHQQRGQEKEVVRAHHDGPARAEADARNQLVV